MEFERTRTIYGTGWEVYKMYVKHMEIRANNRTEDTNIEWGPGLQLNQHWKMSSYESKIEESLEEHGVRQREDRLKMGLSHYQRL